MFADLNKSLRILLIEDNPDDAHLMKKLLADTGGVPIELKWLDKLTIGLKYLAEHKTDVLLLDLSLSETKGLDTLLKVRSHVSDIPIIVLSDIDDEILSVKAVKAGAQDYIVKGHVNSRILTRSIRYAVERYRLISALEKARKIEHYMAYHDTLTKLPNRQLLNDRLNQAIAHARRNSQLMAVLFLDLDKFKDINDTLGHNSGDDMLYTVARRLETCIRENETAARFGGDEFIIILNEILHTQDIIRVAQRILDTVSTPVILNKRKCFISTSIGISVYPSDGNEAETLIKNADIAMYRVKEEGKRNFQFYNKSMNVRFSKRVAMATNLRSAIEKGELNIYYQPQINIRQGNIFSLEALVYWIHPEMGNITSDIFIPIAEETGLMASITEWILNTTCAQNKNWQETGLPLMHISINFSANQLMQKDLLEIVDKILKKNNLSPEYLGFEISETNIIHKKSNIQTFHALKEKGIQLSLDNFGVGYSSLSYLKRLPIEIIKIDRSFIPNIINNPDDVAIIRAIVAMAHILGLKVVAQEVESEAQLTSLLSLECDIIQGNYFSPPIPAKEIPNFIETAKTNIIPELLP